MAFEQAPAQQTRSRLDYLKVAGKGMMMGAADAVPGVSGGTIAFITGIYEELIHSLRQCGPSALAVLFRQGLMQAWRHVNGNFLLALFVGLLISALSVSHLVLYWLETNPKLLWSFFFGLILAAIWSVLRHIDTWRFTLVLAFVVGTVSAYLITEMTPASLQITPLYFFGAGMIAICAMILPGISGAFILVMLGMYAPVMAAIKEFQLMTLSIFAVGCVLGLLSFSHLLSWMFRHYKTMTLALLGGFMLGSLNKVWPWKLTLESMIDRHGKEVPLVQQNILPGTFEAQTGQPSQLMVAAGLMLLGILLVWLMDRVGERSTD